MVLGHQEDTTPKHKIAFTEEAPLSNPIFDPAASLPDDGISP